MSLTGAWAEAGVVDLVASWLGRAGEGVMVRLALLTLLVTAASTVMNNMAVAVSGPLIVRFWPL